MFVVFVFIFIFIFIFYPRKGSLFFSKLTLRDAAANSASEAENGSNQSGFFQGCTSNKADQSQRLRTGNLSSTFATAVLIRFRLRVTGSNKITNRVASLFSFLFLQGSTKLSPKEQNKKLLSFLSNPAGAARRGVSSDPMQSRRGLIQSDVYNLLI